MRARTQLNEKKATKIKNDKHEKPDNGPVRQLLKAVIRDGCDSQRCSRLICTARDSQHDSGAGLLTILAKSIADIPILFNRYFLTRRHAVRGVLSDTGTQNMPSRTLYLLANDIIVLKAVTVCFSVCVCVFMC